MADIAELGIKILSDDIVKATKRLDKLEKQSKQNTKANKKMTNSFSGLGAAIGTLGLGLAFKSIISLAIEQERVVKQLDAAIKSTGGSAGFTTIELQEMAASFQSVTTFGDEAILSMQSVLLTFTNLKGDVLPRTTEAVLDLSARMGIDLQSAAVQLGKALNDPVANLSALSRSGIQFTASQKEVVKELVETNRLADAQAIILKELEVQFGGSAKAARDTFGGALKSLGNAFGDLLEGDGGNLNDAKGAVEELISILQSDGTKKAFAGIVTGVVAVTTALVEGVVALNNFGTALGESLAGGKALTAAKELEQVDEKLKKLGERMGSMNPYSSEFKLARTEIQLLSERWAELNSKITAKGSTDAAGKGVAGVIDPSEEKKEALDAEFEAASSHTDRMIRLIEMEESARQQMSDKEKAASKNKLAVTKGFLGNMSTLMASSSKKEFEVGKKFALANALVKGYEAVTSAYAAGAKIHPAVGVAFAASAAAATKVQIDNIRSQQFGGGGGVSVTGGAGGGVSTGASLGGGAPAPTQQPQGGGGVTTVNLVGQNADTFTGEQVDSMFDSLSEAIERGDKVLFTRNTRQGLEVAA